MMAAVARWKRLLLIVVALLTANTAFGKKVKEDVRVLASIDKRNCQWTRPKHCNESPTFKIKLHFVDSENAPFPSDLKDPVRDAAKFWSRAIVQKRIPSSPIITINNTMVEEQKVIAEKCGLARGTSPLQIEAGDDTLFICVHYLPVETTSGVRPVGVAEPFLLDIANFLPNMARIELNSLYVGKLDYCDWANIVSHEIGHALGFALSLPLFKLLRGPAKSLFRGGPHTKREWDKLNTSLPFPALNKNSNSHWSPLCFSNELMLSTMPEVSGTREPLSALTLAVLEDMGYEVNYDCADKNVPVMTSTCSRENHPFRFRHAWKNWWNKKRFIKKVSKSLQKRFQIIRYKFLMVRTNSRKQRQRVYKSARKRIRRIKAATGKIILQARKASRRMYRRLRRVVRAKVRQMKGTSK